MSAGHSTGMAGEFFVMEQLFRRGHEAALTLGNAKSIDILVSNATKKKTKRISVKSVRGGGKWGVGSEDLSRELDLIFIFLLYKKFEDSYEAPKVWVMPAPKVQEQKQGWLNGTSAIYYGKNTALDKFKDAWNLI